MQDQILDMLLKEDEITWQTILYDLIKKENKTRLTKAIRKKLKK